MKIQKTLTLVALTLTPTLVFAHCPSNYKPETACFMLDKNVVYIYDVKVEHNGPYKDLEKADVTDIKSGTKSLTFKKLARGIFKIDGENQKEVTLVLTQDKKKTEIKVKGE